MKKFLEAYFSFSKPERTGLIALISILLILLLVRVFMHSFVGNDIDAEKEQRSQQSWKEFKANNKPVVKEITKLFPFDPNTIDSTGLRKLGLRAKTTTIFLNWRAKGKVFRKKEELRKVYTLTEKEYLRLEPYIVIEH